MCVIVFSHNPLISTPQVSRYTYLIYITRISTPWGNAEPLPPPTIRCETSPMPGGAWQPACNEKKPYKTAAKSPQRPNGSAKRPVSQPKTARSAAPNSPFRSLKRPLS